MTEQVDLLPCPFCGGQAHYGWRSDTAAIFRPDHKTVFCFCGVDSRDVRRFNQDAVTWWNTRTAPAPVTDAEIEVAVDDFIGPQTYIGGDFSYGAEQGFKAGVAWILKQQEQSK